MSYRDSDEAARARTDALEDEVERLREENAALKAGRRGGRKDPKPDAAAPAPDARAPRSSDGQAALALVTVLGGVALMAVPVGVAIGMRRWEPTGVGAFSITALLFGGPALASAGFQLLFPWVPLYETDANGEQTRVLRSQRSRRVRFAVALAVYAVGAVAAFFAR